MRSLKLPTGIKIQAGQEWQSFNVCHDKASEKWSVRHECKICNKQIFTDALDDEAAVGNRISNLLKVPVCKRCLDLVSKYKNYENSS